MRSDAAARALARRLIARAAEVNHGAVSAPVAIQAACERTYRELSRWVGPAGSHALLTRSLAEAQLQHSFLKDIRVGELSRPGMEGVTEIIAAHGDSAVSKALEAVLQTLLELLGRLIGDDMAARLVEFDSTQQLSDNEGTT
jgi:hypothetical protein